MHLGSTWWLVLALASSPCSIARTQLVYTPSHFVAALADDTVDKVRLETLQLLSQALPRLFPTVPRRNMLMGRRARSLARHKSIMHCLSGRQIKKLSMLVALRLVTSGPAGLHALAKSSPSPPPGNVSIDAPFTPGLAGGLPPYKAWHHLPLLMAGAMMY